MATYTDLLPPSKTSPNRVVKYTPACAGIGTLEVQDKRTSTRYAVCVQPFGGVRLTKADGETYVVSPAACECKGFVFGRGALCRHIESLHAITSNGWLDMSGVETVTDRDAEVQEMDRWYCEATGGKMAYEPLGA